MSPMSETPSTSREARRRIARHFKGRLRPHPSIRRAFSILAALIKQEDAEYVRDMYVVPHDACVPDGYGDDDLSGAIVDKFYWWYRGVADVVAADAGLRPLDLSVVVQPSWEDESGIVLMYSRRIVLMYEWIKAWRFGGRGSLGSVLRDLQRDYDYLSKELEDAIVEHPNAKPTLVYNS